MKKTVAILLCAMMLFTLVGCQSANSPPPTTEPTPSPAAVSLEEYKSLIAECNEAIMEEAVLLSNMGKWEHSYWENLNNIGGIMDYENMVDRATAWLNENAEIEDGTLEDNYSSICDQYKKIVETACETDVEAISTTMDDLFSSFNSYYLLVTSPSGKIDTFADDFNRLTKEIKNSNSILSTLTSE